MSLFLNALKTLADRPEPGFPAVGPEHPPNEQKSSASANPTAEQGLQTEAEPTGSTEPNVESKLQSKLPVPKELLSQLRAAKQEATEPKPSSDSSTAALPTAETPAEASGNPTGSWTTLWEQAVANPTPIEVTQDEPDSPEEIALSDLKEIAEVTRTPELEPPASAAETTSEDQSEEESAGEETAHAERPVTPTRDEISSEEENDAPASQDLKFSFAPWFEAYDKASDAEQDAAQNAEASKSELSEESNHAESEDAASHEITPTEPDEETLSPAVSAPDESAVEPRANAESPAELPTTKETKPAATTQESESYWGSEAFDPYAGTSSAAEKIEENTEGSADEQGAIEEPSSADERVSEAAELPESAADLLVEPEAEATSAIIEKETWTLYDRTAGDWTENRTKKDSEVPEPAKLTEERSSAEVEQEARSEAAEPVYAESEPPSSQIAAALESFAAKVQQHAPLQDEATDAVAPANEREEVAAKTFTAVEEPTVSEGVSSLVSTTKQLVQEIRVTEPYLRLATRLCQSLGAGRPQAIAIAAVDKAACRTLNIAQLARALTLVEEGDVLVVQGSEVRPDLAHQLGVLPSKRPRWAKTGGGDLAEKIICNAESQLALLPYQSLGSSPIQLVDPLLLARCKRHYSLILVETGDLSSEASQSLISQADIGLMTAILHYTPREHAAQSAALLRRLGVRISGCVLCEARSAA